MLKKHKFIKIRPCVSPNLFVCHICGFRSKVMPIVAFLNYLRLPETALKKKKPSELQDLNAYLLDIVRINNYNVCRSHV